MKKVHAQKGIIPATLDLLGDRWTLLIVKEIFLGHNKFQDLAQVLTGISPALLSTRLKNLEKNKLVVRETYEEYPPRKQYVLTRHGYELGIVLGALEFWGSRYFQRPSTLLHVTCGHALNVDFHCPHCSSSVKPNEILLETVKKPPVAFRRTRKKPSKHA